MKGVQGEAKIEAGEPQMLQSTFRGMGIPTGRTKGELGPFTSGPHPKALGALGEFSESTDAGARPPAP